MPAGGEDFGDGRAAMGRLGDADMGAAEGAVLLPALAGRGLGRVGDVVDRRRDLRTLGPGARIAEMLLAMNPHDVGPPEAVTR